jgi:hypothetical protein
MNALFNENKIFKENNKLDFSFEDYDHEFSDKIDYLWNTYKLTLNVETCFFCLGPAKIVCEKCNSYYYCTEEHKEKEWKIYHFFECHIVQLMRNLKNYKGHNLTSNLSLI